MDTRSLLLIACLILSPPGLDAASQTISAGGDVSGALQQLQPGDTLTLEPGTYAGFDNPPSGSSSAPVTIAGAAGGAVILTGGSGSGNFMTISSSQYVVFDNLVIDATGVGSAGFKVTGSACCITVQNTEIKGAGAQGVLANSSGGKNIFRNLKVHDNGSSAQFDHGLYIASPDNIVEGSEIFNNKNFGVHVYGEGEAVTRNIIRANRIHHNGSGMVLGAGSDNIAYNNLVYANGTGIQLRNGGNNTQAYNNTIVANTGGDSGGSCLMNANSGSVLRNNICWQNQTNSVNGGGDAVESNNLFDDPQFMDANAGDYRLKEGSPAIKAGVDLSSIFKDDITGAQRPAGAFDLGAYASGATAPPGGGTGGGQASLPPPRHLRLLQSSATPTATPTP